jgi:hypothetical protein
MPIHTEGRIAIITTPKKIYLLYFGPENEAQRMQFLSDMIRYDEEQMAEKYKEFIIEKVDVP